MQTNPPILKRCLRRSDTTAYIWGHLFPAGSALHCHEYNPLQRFFLSSERQTPVLHGLFQEGGRCHTKRTALSYYCVQKITVHKIIRFCLGKHPDKHSP